MAISAFPIATVPPAANLITCIPVGSVTATDVQAAIQQLENSIPLPGPGTDPLFLTQGLAIDATDPTIHGDPNNRHSFHCHVTTNTLNSDPSFANTSSGHFTMSVQHGQNAYNALTLAKESFFGLSTDIEAIGAGQRFVYSNNMVAYGMGDVALHGNDYVQFGGGPTDGDEGQGWGLASALTQQTFLSQTTIATVPTPSVLNTTTTQVINKSQFVQTVTVVSTAGAVAGDWVVVDQELPSPGTNMEAVQIISFGPTSITGIFRCNHNNGCTITPALLLTLGSTFTLGQDRVLVNWSQPSYSTGTIASITGGGYTGSGTNWTDNMVGGWAKNIGAIALTADDYAGSPFSLGNPLKSVYQIKSLVSPTSLGILSTSVAGDASYHGRGPGPAGSGGSGVYKIVPCAKILRIQSGLVICETSTSIWTIGDSVEQVICPYPDVGGFQYNMSVFTTGGIRRYFMHVNNQGARKFDAFISLEDWSTIHQSGADGVQWGSVLDLACACDYIIKAAQCPVQLGAFLLPSAAGGAGFTDAGGSISWGITSITPNSPNSGLDFKCTPEATLAFSLRSTPRNPDPSLSKMAWPGYFHLQFPSGVIRPYMLFDNDAPDLVNYTRVRMQYDGQPFTPGFVIETQLGGIGIASDIVLKTNGVEQFRCVSGSTVQFSNPVSFSANGSVATALTSIGPTGAHATVQKWLTVKDDSGTTLYIPCF